MGRDSNKSGEVSKNVSHRGDPNLSGILSTLSLFV